MPLTRARPPRGAAATGRLDRNGTRRQHPRRAPSRTWRARTRGCRSGSAPAPPNDRAGPVRLLAVEPRQDLGDARVPRPAPGPCRRHRCAGPAGGSRASGSPREVSPEEPGPDESDQPGRQHPIAPHQPRPAPRGPPPEHALDRRLGRHDLPEPRRRPLRDARRRSRSAPWSPPARRPAATRTRWPPGRPTGISQTPDVPPTPGTTPGHSLASRERPYA